MRLTEIGSKPTFIVVLCVLTALVLPRIIDPIIVMKLMELGLFGCSINFLLGRAKLLSFGHAAFFGSGCYAAAYAMTNWGITPEMALLGGLAIGAVLGFIFGALAIRRRGIYFSMITLALAQLLYFGFLKAPFTHGEDGIQGVPRGNLFGLFSLEADMSLYYVIAAVSFIAFWFIWRVSKSPYGRALQALGEHEPRSASLGIPPNRMKHLAFVISASIAGLAGSMHALIFQMANLSGANWHFSGEGVLMALLGGIGSVFGPILGAAIMTAIETGLAEKAGALVPVFMGSMFMTATLIFRKGIAGALDTALARASNLAKQPDIK